uniref:NADH dehydrogenase subunit 6 n=1 Tax=Acrobeles complexus TaxID=293684 RepID=A0A0H3V2L7_9BILA|nr:NADH dehydrogenase subunit 6 [Acrobeles complexus]
MMVIMYSLSVLAATSSYVAINPMSSSLYFVLAFIFVLPILGSITYIWVAYLVALLFMSGVFVLLVYFAGISKIYYKPVSGVFVLIVFHLLFMLFFPFILVTPLDLNMSFLYEPEQLLMVVFIVIVLLLYMMFVSYLLGSGSSMRRL